jgi:hypothetical protein
MFSATQGETEHDNGHVRSMRGVPARHGPFKFVKRDSRGVVTATDRLGFVRIFRPDVWILRNC